MTAIDRPDAHVPRAMSTQHPDNVAFPIFAQGPVMSAEDEVREAFYAFAHLGCDEQMWDFEGKEVDNFVVQKLLTQYGSYFRANPLGERLRLTPRVPNPRVEPIQAKGLLEVLHSLPRHADAARLFHGSARPPILEVIFPMTTSALELDRIRTYYLRNVVGAASESLIPGDISVSTWCGDFEPADIGVIPLIEDLPYLLEADRIVGEYVRGKELAYQRVFIARSDPALNYGITAAVLASLVALDRLDALQLRTGIPILPIIGCGGAPFRGGLRPASVERVLATYPSVQTFTLQSAFKYDHPVAEVRRAIDALHAARRGPPVAVAADARLLAIMERTAARYRAEIREIAGLVNRIAPHIPRRRLRKLHIGLFGYSRDDDELSLPRAITFCASLYSVGLPPELLGFAALDRDDWEYLKGGVPGLADQIQEGLGLLDPGIGPELPPLVAESVRAAQDRCDAITDQEHLEIARETRVRSADGAARQLGELVVRSGGVRGFLG
jgi:phosphoenolpyruvate carboxylase